MNNSDPEIPVTQTERGFSISLPALRAAAESGASSVTFTAPDGWHFGSDRRLHPDNPGLRGEPASRQLTWHRGRHGWDKHDGFPRHQHSLNGCLTINPDSTQLHFSWGPPFEDETSTAPGEPAPRGESMPGEDLRWQLIMAIARLLAAANHANAGDQEMPPGMQQARRDLCELLRITRNDVPVPAITMMLYATLFPGDVRVIDLKAGESWPVSEAGPR